MASDIQFERGKAYTVDRGSPRLRTGQGMLAGMGVVWKHFRDAFTKKLDDPSETSGVFTVQYPEERAKLPEAFRNFPILLYEDSTGQELCTSCFQCERICPPQVIHITQAKDPATGKAVPAAEEFLLEYDACMSCGLCSEVCPFDAIKMDHEFELSTADHPGLTIDRAGLLRPVSYYERIAPTFWAEVRDAALKKLQGAAKRRPGTVGLAPAFAERRQAELDAAVPPAVVAPAAPAADPADPKAARLAAIRAANAAKAAAPTAPETPATAEAPAATGDAKTDKAARLAAIRAANAAKAAAPTAPETPATAEAPEAPEPIVVPAPPGDAKAEKAARLAAIRAANAAKREAEE